MQKIQKIHAREVLDSRGFPTVEVEVTLSTNSQSPQPILGRAIVPSGASTGSAEALELRDGDSHRYCGKGVLKAIENIKTKIAPCWIGQPIPTQSELDQSMIALDQTPNKSNLGANAILGVSMAFAQACAIRQQTTLAQHLQALSPSALPLRLPVPLMNILNGGQHADNDLSIQEFMIVPAGFTTFSDALRAGVETFHALKKILHSKHLSTSVGDEGGFAPHLSGSHPHTKAMEYILQAIETAGYKPGQDIFLALDAASSEFYDAQNNHYHFEGQKLSSSDLIAIYQSWLSQFPIVSIEDGLAEQDWKGWAHLTKTLGAQCQLVGDDVFVTQMAYLKKGIDLGVANAILIKLNQVGTVTETLNTMQLGHQANYGLVTSHRSGETEDTFIAALAIGTGCGQIKTGSASRTDRISKYNELLRYEETLGTQATFGGIHPFKKFLGLNKKYP